MEEFQKEEWNMAMAYFQRIDDLLTLCDRYQMENKMLYWYKTLIALYKELYPKMSPEEKEIINAKLISMRNHIFSSKRISHHPFLDFELFLRMFMERKSMLTPKKDLRGL